MLSVMSSMQGLQGVVGGGGVPCLMWFTYAYTYVNTYTCNNASWK